MTSVPRLDKGTELNRSPVHDSSSVPSSMYQKILTVRDYGQGCVEVGISPVPAPNANDVDRRRYLPQAEFSQFKQIKPVDLDRSVRRSKATVRRKCMAGGLDHLLTLTYRENKVDVESAFSDLKRFIRLVRESIPSFKYVAVSEYQDRGSVHFHLAVKGFQNVRLLRSLWQKVVGENNGNIDVQAPLHKYAGSPWNLAKLAGYISKYITKAASELFGKQRYRVAEGIDLPMHRTTVWFPAGVDILGEVFDSIGVDLGYRYEAEQGWAWGCSWT